jgi:hypothetical protein
VTTVSTSFIIIQFFARVIVRDCFVPRLRPRRNTVAFVVRRFESDFVLVHVRRIPFLKIRFLTFSSPKAHSQVTYNHHITIVIMMTQVDITARPGFTPPSGKPPASSGISSSPMVLTPGAVTDEGTPNPPSTAESAQTKNFTPTTDEDGWSGTSWSSDDVSTST